MTRRRIIQPARKRLLRVRVDWPVYEDLVVESQVRKSCVAEVVRHVLNEHQMRGEKLRAMREEIAAMRGELSKVRHELALATDVLLSFGGRLAREDAREWVNENLGKEV